MRVSPFPQVLYRAAPYIITENPDQLVDFRKAAFGALENRRVPGRDRGTGHAEI